MVSGSSSQSLSYARALLLNGLIVLVLFAGVNANAEDGLIRVTWLQGQVSYRYDSGEEWSPLISASRLQLPVEVKTYENSGINLAQGESSFSIRENSHIELTNSGMRSVRLIDRVLQIIGTVLYQVETTGDDFVVETPFLAATVKGTRFVVVASEQNSLVTLQEGALEVLDLDSGDTQMMLPGDVVGADAVAANAAGNANGGTATGRDSNVPPGLARVQTANANAAGNRLQGSGGQGPDGQSRGVDNPIAAAARQQRGLAQNQRTTFGRDVSANAGLIGITTAIEAKQQRDNRGRGRGNENGNGN